MDFPVQSDDDAKIEPPFTACNLDNPYIFVSYAHKDKKDVYPEIKRSHAAGYRIWYDEGLTPSEEWMENIAISIDRCEKMIIFLSPAAVTSQWVNREISLGIKREKPIVPVFLKETELPLKFELAFGNIQHIYKNELKKAVYKFKVEKSLPLTTKNGNINLLSVSNSPC